MTWLLCRLCQEFLRTSVDQAIHETKCIGATRELLSWEEQKYMDMEEVVANRPSRP